MRTSHVTVAIVALATIIISLFIMCGVPADPFDKSKTKVSLVLKSSDGQQSKVTITDTIGATDSIIVSIDLAQHFDSIIVTVKLNSVKVDSFKFDDTTSIYATAAYGVKFLKAGNYQVNITGYVEGLPNREVDGQISIVDRTEENLAPSISIRGRHVVTAGNRAILIVKGTDPNPGQTASVVASRLPDDATFNADTFSWVTALEDVGMHIVVFNASDNGNPVMSVRDSITITVTAATVNEPPKWSSDTVSLFGRPGTPISLSFGNECIDPDGDSLQFLLVGQPEGDAISATTWSYTPGAGDIGRYFPTIVAFDPSGEADTLTIELTIANEDRTSPVMKLIAPALDSQTISASSFTVKISCVDQSGVKVVTCSMGSTTFDITTSSDTIYSATITNLKSGFNTIQFIATDKSPAANQERLFVTLNYDADAPDNVAPTITLVAPSKDTLIGQDSCEISVRCVDESGIASVTIGGVKASREDDDVFTATVKALSGGKNTITIVATDSAVTPNVDSTSVDVAYDDDAEGPELTLVSPDKDSATTNSTGYTILLRATDESGVLSVRGTHGSDSFTGARDTGKVWKLSVTGLAANEVNTIVLTITDSSLHANKTRDTVYITSEIINGHTVTFIKNDAAATGTMEPQTMSSGVETALSANAFVKTGWTFAGWATSATGEVEFEDGAAFTIDASDVKLYAVWSETTHKVTFNKNDATATGTMAVQNIAEGAEVTLSANAFVKVGSSFTGWATSATGAVVYTDAASYTMGTADVILYAKWSASDNIPPTITLVSPSKDTTVGVDSCRISVRCTDGNGVALVKIGTVTAVREAGGVFSATVKGLVNGSNTITIVATDSAATPHTDSTQVKITYDSDVAGPTITKITPAKDSVATNSANYTVTLTCTDQSGVKSVNGAQGTTKYTGTRGSGSTWDIAVSGLAEGVYTKVVFTATDSSLRANTTPLTLYIKYDPTMGDVDGPTIKQISGPASGSVVSDPLVTIIDSITDPSNVDSVFWTLNNGPAKLMTPVTGKAGQYSLTETLVREKLDTIVVTAVDKSTLRNRSSQTIVLNYIIPPTITVPPASKKICSGGEAAVSVTASGTAPLSYQWKNTAGNILGATAATYTLSSVTATTTLTCVVSNGAVEKATSNEATITIAPVVTVAASPASAGACSGGSATFTAVALGGSGFGYQWYKGTSPVGTSISGATSATLNVNAVEGDGTFYCIVKNIDGCSGTSNSVAFTKSSDVTLTIESTGTAICTGGDVTLTAKPVGGSGHSYQWYSGVTKVGTNSATYKATTAATYRCEATNSAGCKGEATFEVKANTGSTAPTLRVKSNGATAVCPGVSVVIEIVPGTGSLGTGAQWRWFKNNVNAVNDGKSEITDNPTSLTKYTAKAVGGACGDGPESNPITITINSPPVDPTGINATPTSVCAGSNSPVALTVSGTLSGAGAKWVWYKGSIANANKLGEGNAAQDIPVGTTTYYVRAEGTCGNSNPANTQVVVNAKPPQVIITTAPSEWMGGTFFDGEITTLAVFKSDSYTGYTYTLYKDGQPVARYTVGGSFSSDIPSISVGNTINRTLFYINIDASTAGTYRCRISTPSNCYIETGAASIVVSNALHITNQPLSGCATVSSTTYDVSVIVAGGAAPYSYQWYIEGGGMCTDYIEFSGTATSTMSVKPWVLNSNRNYYCIITDAANEQITSASANVKPCD